MELLLLVVLIRKDSEWVQNQNSPTFTVLGDTHHWDVLFALQGKFSPEQCFISLTNGFFFGSASELPVIQIFPLFIQCIFGTHALFAIHWKCWWYLVSPTRGLSSRLSRRVAQMVLAARGKVWSKHFEERGLQAWHFDRGIITLLKI